LVCVDEKSRFQALDRTAPLLPMRFDSAERRNHDYPPWHHHAVRRVGVATGKITADACYDRRGDRPQMMSSRFVFLRVRPAGGLSSAGL